MNPFATHGAFSWPELHTSDADAAAAFYAEIFPWETIIMDMPTGPYVTARIDGVGVAGIFNPAEKDIPVRWGVYVCVDDTDVICQKAIDAGGQVVWPGEDVPGVGRLAHIMDPQGASLGIVSFSPREDGGPVADVGEAFGVPGRFSWFELRVPDIQATIPFYKAVFGWEIDVDNMHMGPYGIIKLDGVGYGGMMSVSPDEVPPHWGLYVTVADVDAWTKAVSDAGGEVLFPVVNVPDVGRFTMIKDPQGGVLAGMQYQTPDAT